MISSGCIPSASLSKFIPFNVFQNARREKLERMGEEILDLWQQLDIGKDEQVTLFGLAIDDKSTNATPGATCPEEFFSCVILKVSVWLKPTCCCAVLCSWCTCIESFAPEIVLYFVVCFWTCVALNTGEQLLETCRMCSRRVWTVWDFRHWKPGKRSSIAFANSRPKRLEILFWHQGHGSKVERSA